MQEFPDVVTHNFDPDRGPFHNICGLSEAAAEQILDEIRASGRRSIKANYLPRRLAVEEWLIAEKIRKLCPTQLDRPIYFFLGNFADGVDRSRPNSIVMPLSAFSPEVLTFTYPDSMASLPLSQHDDHLAHRKDHHGEVFTLAEIRAVVAKFGMPGERWKSEPSMFYDRFIEVQVWDHGPIERFLSETES